MTTYFYRYDRVLRGTGDVGMFAVADRVLADPSFDWLELSANEAQTLIDAVKIEEWLEEDSYDSFRTRKPSTIDRPPQLR